MDVNYHVVNNTIVLNFAGKHITVKKGHPLWDKVIYCIKSDKIDDIPELVDVETKLAKLKTEKFTLVDGKVYSYGEPINEFIATRIIDFIDNDLPFDYLVNFWNNLKENPSDQSINNLFKFLEANTFPITADGHFIAYKRVRSDYKDFYTGEIDNTPGTNEPVEISRDRVDANENNTCSTGLHIAAFEYARDHYHSGEGLIVEVKVNPRDVVTVPPDYDNQKCRCCKYYVIKDASSEFEKFVVDGSEYTSVGDIVDESPVDELLSPICSVCNEAVECCECGIDQVEEEPEIMATEMEIKIGNYKYSLWNDHVSFEFVAKVKPSRWAKAFREAIIDIKEIHRAKTTNSSKIWDGYIVVTSKDTMVFLKNK